MAGVNVIRKAGVEEGCCPEAASATSCFVPWELTRVDRSPEDGEQGRLHQDDREVDDTLKKSGRDVAESNKEAEKEQPCK